MADRIIKVNAYTTFNILDGEAEGHGWTEEALAVLNVTSGDAGDVVVEIELDNTETEKIPAHADRVRLSPGDARELASELESYADRVASDD